MCVHNDSTYIHTTKVIINVRYNCHKKMLIYKSVDSKSSIY